MRDRGDGTRTAAISREQSEQTSSSKYSKRWGGQAQRAPSTSSGVLATMRVPQSWQTSV